MEMIWLVIGVVVIVGFMIVNIYNQLVKYKIKVEEGASGIDVALVKRYDTITNLVECVKGYAKHETETLEKVIELRNSMSMKEKSDLENQYSEAQTKLFAIAEAYPDLKASANFEQLQKSIFDVEEHLQAARRLYNSNVSIFNQKVEMFPSNLIASIMKFSKFDFFEANENEKQNVNIQI